MSGNRTYLPVMSDPEIRAFLETGVFPEQTVEYERLGLDRALFIASDLALRTGGASGFSLLDVGCNNGLIGRTLGVLGNRVLGIDSGIIETQNFYAENHLSDSETFSFRRMDLLNLLRAEDSSGLSWDAVLLLSVAHHWTTGYAMSGKGGYSASDIHFIFETLAARVSRGIYMELPFAEPGFDSAWLENFLETYCTPLFRTTELRRTIGTNGFLRTLLYLEPLTHSLPAESSALRLRRLADRTDRMELSRLTSSRAEVFRLKSERGSI